jgi:outer membrane protein assembly factor BamB
MTSPIAIRTRGTLGALALAAGLAVSSPAADRPQWGEAWTRNMASPETGLPSNLDAGSSNLLWSTALGTETYATPVVGGGRVYIGTNNGVPRDPKHQGDRGVLMCFDEKDGRLLWQLVVTKIEGDVYLDWPGAGMSSPPTVDGKRVYLVTNRGQVVALDPKGMADGNDGPFREEADVMTPPGAEPIRPGPTDADILWLTDLVAEAGIYTHDAAHTSILVDGPLLYLNTGNGVDNTHRLIRKPDAPSLVVIDKETGRIVARDGERIGPRIVHSQWSSPALGEADGNRLVFFGGADAVVYAFKALPGLVAGDRPVPLETVWSFDCDPGTVKVDACALNGKREAGNPSTIHSMPVFHEGCVYAVAGGDPWWGKHEARLWRIDAGGTGDVTKTAAKWSYDLKRHSTSTPAIRDGLIFLADWGRTAHCVEAATGRPVWTRDVQAEVWASPLVADGKLYVATRRGTVHVFSADREGREIARCELDSPISASPVAANGTIFIATMKKLYAFRTPTPNRNHNRNPNR